uniref:Uncharacterized protein n=1 Tax=Amphimedon queenslandica TaxID=400682 RepID=A0A1X7T6T3_AMPQE
MCLRFVAGLTHLEHESYQQYFNKQLDLQCKRNTLFGLKTSHLSHFYQNREIVSDHISSNTSENYSILLFQLLYESQSLTSCRLLAQSINNHTLCLDGISLSLSLFDWLCLSYSIKYSNTTWNHLHLDLGLVSNQSLSVFTAGLTNTNSLKTQCKSLDVKLSQQNDDFLQNFLQPSLLYNIQECYCELLCGQYVPCLVLLQFLNLPQLKILHLRMDYSTIPTIDIICCTEKCTELEKCIEINSTLEEMKIDFDKQDKISIVSVIKGVTRNKTIKSLTLKHSASLPGGLIEQFLKDNDTLQALSVDFLYQFLPSSNIEVNTPLNALEIRHLCDTSSLLQHIKGLDCLILYVPEVPYPPNAIFLSHPSLHTLTLPLHTAESAIELFTILQTNTTLKALRVTMYRFDCTNSVGKSLQEMLTKNQSLKLFEITDLLTSSFLSSLTKGISHNTSLQQLHVSIQFIDIAEFFDVISQKNNLTEFELDVFLTERHYTLLYDKVLPAITNMLQSHTAIRLLRIHCG